MKRKFFIGGAALLFAAATLFNMSFLTGNNAGDVSMQSIAIMAKAGKEYPHYGSYGRDMMDCSMTFQYDGETRVCYKGICLPIEVNGEVTISCTNCAWDCNKDGANNTCDPESC